MHCFPIILIQETGGRLITGHKENEPNRVNKEPS